MKQRQTAFSFLSVAVFLLIFVSPTKGEKIVSTDKIAYFTDSQLSEKCCPSTEKIPSSLSLSSRDYGQKYSSQTDTTKKKITLPNKGIGQKKNPPRASSMEVDGLLLNTTFSPGGYDFYVALSQNFTPPNGAYGYHIVVKEYEGRGVNITLAVEVNGKQLVYRRMRPIYPAVNGLAISVANYLSGYLTRGDHLSGVDADGNFIDIQQTDVTRRIKTPFDIY
ncbi:MAG: hypothetical protein AAF960_02505 [Bacteroidota bacterium]